MTKCTAECNRRKMAFVMDEFRRGTLKSGGSGAWVTNPKQAAAIAYSVASAHCGCR